MEYEYGNIMLEDGDIESLDEWSDDKEVASSIMDRVFDYLWDYSNGKIHYIDRLYDSGIEDSMTESRRESGELELWFNNFTEVFKWIRKRADEKGKGKWSSWIDERIKRGE